jgi:hypothetical protein
LKRRRSALCGLLQLGGIQETAAASVAECLEHPQGGHCRMPPSPYEIKMTRVAHNSIYKMKICMVAFKKHKKGEKETIGFPDTIWKGGGCRMIGILRRRTEELTPHAWTEELINGRHHHVVPSTI